MDTLILNVVDPKFENISNKLNIIQNQIKELQLSLTDIKKEQSTNKLLMQKIYDLLTNKINNTNNPNDI
jgi:hypothetical protein